MPKDSGRELNNETAISLRGVWNSRLGFILAAAGSAVGLGNIWKFPYICGENGGGIFVFIYLVCIFFIGIPIMISEIMLGRGTKKSPVGAFESLSGKGSPWTMAGWLGIISGFIILSYYSVVAGWTLNYTLLSFCDFYHVQVNKEFTVTEGSQDKQDNLNLFEIEHRSAAKSIVVYYSGDDKISRLAVKDEDYKLIDDNTKNKLFIAPIKKEGIKTFTIKYHVPKEPTVLRGIFDKLYSALGVNILWHTIFMLVCIGIVCRGVSDGIEKWSRILMPLLVIILLVLLVNSLMSGGFSQAVKFLLGFDFSRLKPSGVLEALGHAFFTLSLGMGAMLTYGSYLDKKTDIVKSAVQISILDTLIAVLACFVIFPIVFAYGFPPQGGPGLVFQTMPVIFSQMLGGAMLGLLFFILLAFAALTSAISLLEVVTAYFVDEMNVARKKAAIISGLFIYILGLFSAAAGSGAIFPQWKEMFGMNFFDTMDFLATNWLLPLGGLLISVYAGWVIPARWREEQFKSGSTLGAFYGVWLISVRFIAPVSVALVFLQKMGFIDIDKLIG
jgi:NSS family neurotransmitter:Na+ symporter